MPIYEYACQKCGKVVEVFQKVNERGPKACAKCGGKLARVLSNTSFQLKGGGWYKDLYASAKPGSSNDSEGPSGESSGDSKPEVKAEAKAESAGTETKKAEAKKTDGASGKTETKPAKSEAKADAKPAAKADGKTKKAAAKR